MESNILTKQAFQYLLYQKEQETNLWLAYLENGSWGVLQSDQIQFEGVYEECCNYILGR